MKTVAFLPAHPAQVWVLSEVAKELSGQARVKWFIRDKDRSSEIAAAQGIDYTVISAARSGLIGNAVEMLIDTVRAVRLTRSENIDLWVTKFGAGNIAAWLLGGKSVSFNDDDADLVPLIAATSYRFANKVLVTDVTRMGRYEHKAARYPSLHELFYLHPTRFEPDPNVKKELGVGPSERYGIIRLSALTSHHDRGIRGLQRDLVSRLIHKYQAEIRIFISSEKPLDGDLAEHRFPLRPERMHHALAHADFFLGDSQTMTSEAAVLGTPAVRINDFVGRISTIAELERLGLAYGFKPGQEDHALETLEFILRKPAGKVAFSERRMKLLEEKIDPVPWFAEQIMNVLTA